MAWFYNSYSGELTHADGLDALAYEAAIHTGSGWHELKIADSATEAQAAAEAKKEVPTGTTPTTGLATGIANAATNNPVTSALSGLLPSFTNLRDFVVRAVKVVAGLALVIVGVSRMAGADKQVIGTAKKVLA